MEARKSKRLWRRALGLVVSVGLILVIFVGVIPQFASYADAWTAIQSMSTAWLVALIVAAAVNQISYVWPYQAVPEHLRYRHGFFETQTCSAISNTVPAGGAVAYFPPIFIGLVTYAIWKTRPGKRDVRDEPRCETASGPCPVKPGSVNDAQFPGRVIVPSCPA